MSETSSNESEAPSWMNETANEPEMTMTVESEDFDLDDPTPTKSTTPTPTRPEIAPSAFDAFAQDLSDGPSASSIVDTMPKRGRPPGSGKKRPSDEQIAKMREGLMAKRARDKAAAEVAADEPEEEVDNAASPRKERIVSKGAKREVGPPPSEMLPSDEIAALEAEGIVDILLDIKRNLPGAGFAQVKTNLSIPLKAVYNLMPAVMRFSGGGRYMYSIYDPTTRQLLCSRWYERYEGATALPPTNTHTIVWNEERQQLEVTTIADATGANIGLSPYSLAAGGAAVTQGLIGPMGSGPSMMGGVQPVAWGQQQSAAAPQMSHDDLRMVAAQQSPSPQRDARGNLMSPPLGFLPKWAASGAFTPEQQWDMILNARVAELEKNLATQGGGAAVGISNQWVNHEIRQGTDARIQVASLQAEIRNLQQNLQAQITTAQKEAHSLVEIERERREKAERDAERARSEAAVKALEARLEAMQQANAQPRGPDWGSLLPALAPTVLGYIQHTNETARAERDAQTKMLMTVLTKKDDGGMDLLKTFAPLAVPLVSKWMESNGPQAQAEVLQIEHEKSMMTLKMMADMVAASAPDTPQAEWYVPMIQNLVGNGLSFMQRLAQQNAARQLPPNAGQPQQAPQQAAEQAPEGPSLIDQLRQEDPDAARNVELIYSQLPREFGFHTHEWITILFHLHTKLMADELAPIIADHLVHCETFKLMPKPLSDANVFEQPQQALTLVFSQLPITQSDPQYVAEIISSVVETLEEMSSDDDEDEPAAAPPQQVIEVGLAGNPVSMSPVRAEMYRKMREEEAVAAAKKKPSTEGHGTTVIKTKHETTPIDNSKKPGASKKRQPKQTVVEPAAPSPMVPAAAREAVVLPPPQAVEQQTGTDAE